MLVFSPSYFPSHSQDNIQLSAEGVVRARCSESIKLNDELRMKLRLNNECSSEDRMQAIKNCQEIIQSIAVKVCAGCEHPKSMLPELIASGEDLLACSKWYVALACDSAFST